MRLILPCSVTRLAEALSIYFVKVQTLAKLWFNSSIMDAPTSLLEGLKRKGKSILQNFEELKLYEDDKLVASMKTDAIAEQLKAITGLDRDLYQRNRLV